MRFVGVHVENSARGALANFLYERVLVDCLLLEVVYTFQNVLGHVDLVIVAFIAEMPLDDTVTCMVRFIVASRFLVRGN